MKEKTKDLLLVQVVRHRASGFSEICGIEALLEDQINSLREPTEAKNGGSREAGELAQARESAAASWIAKSSKVKAGIGSF